MEIMIVVSLLVILAAVLMITLNPMTQIFKGYDAKRKQELTQLSKVFEDYYNDHQCYPPPPKVCFDSVTSRADGTFTCDICGSESTSPVLSPYMTTLPCDPQKPSKKYLYQVDSQTCPSYYRAYADLATDPNEFCTSDNSGVINYDWGVASPNTIPAIDCNLNVSPTVTPTPEIGGPCSSYSDLYYNPFCNICGSSGNNGPPPGPYQKCQSDHPSDTFFIDAGVCHVACVKD